MPSNTEKLMQFLFKFEFQPLCQYG